MKNKRSANIAKILANDALIDEAMDEAAAEATRVHRAFGVPLVEWRNNQIVYIDPFTDKIVPPPKSNGRRPRR